MRAYLIILYILLSFSAVHGEKSQSVHDQIKQAERLASSGETANSLLMLNSVIDRLTARRPSHADSLLLLRAYQMNASNYQGLGNQTQALSYYHQAIGIARQTQSTRQLAELYNNVFGIYYARREFDQALDLLNMALNINTENRDSANIRNNYNNLGLVYYERGDYAKAIDMMNRAIAYTEASDSLGLSLVYTNRGEVFYKQDDLVRAEAELKTAFRLQSSLPFQKQMLQTLLNMALVEARLGKQEDARRLEHRVVQVLSQVPISMQANSHQQLAEIDFVLGDSIGGLHHVLDYQSIADSLQRINSESQLQQLLVAYDAERLKQNNANLKQTVSDRNVFLLITGLFLLILSVLLLLLFKRMKSDRTKNQLISEQREQLRLYEQQEHERQQRMLSLEIDHKNRQLTSYTIDLAAVNEFHQKIMSQISEIRDEMGGKRKETDRRLKELLMQLQHYNDKPVGEDFRLYFDEVHPEFLQNLSRQYPHLTKTDLRLCAYLHLGMSTKEIAALTYREIRSVESSRNRLRKKLGLPPDANLQEFLRTADN
ncbi:MAG: tetratricopeptide repeat protein [Prevotella sp.]|nr:tetratricopeptide repeat protein [Prevotella sp.]